MKAHVFLCMLAYYVEHHMRNALAPILFADHQPEARERASIVAPAQPSPAAVEKCTKRRAVDGTPIMAWHDLIGQLGTINEVALPLGQRRTNARSDLNDPLEKAGHLILDMCGRRQVTLRQVTSRPLK